MSRKKKPVPVTTVEEEQTEFTFDQLSKEAKERAIEEWRNNDPLDYEWYDSVYDQWYEKLEKIGFEDAKIWFSGFSSQGDGACFDADCNVEKLAKHLKYYKTFNAWYLTDILSDSEGKFDIYDINLKINTVNHHYSHENTRDLEWQSYEGIEDQERISVIEDFAGECEELRTQLCREIYKDLEADYGYHTSDETIGETLIVNEYTFDSEGERL